MMCGSLCIVRASSWIPGRLELMHHVFQVIILSGEVVNVYVGVWARGSVLCRG